jgi:drug/metabolite transporter (DMT)-like permease
VTAVFSLLYLAVAGSIAAFGLNYWLLKRMNASKIMLMSVAQPLLAVVLLEWIVLGETWAGRTLRGESCILLSIGLTFSSKNRNGQEEDI